MRMVMGSMGFDEFVGWFRRTCAGIERYRRGLAQANAAGGKAGVVGVVASPAASCIISWSRDW